MRRILFLFTVLCFLIAPIEAKAEDFTEEQKAEIQKMFEEYLLENGDKIIDSVSKYQERAAEEERAEAAKQAEAFVANISKRDDLPTAGNADGDVVVVEFFDYNCGYCRRALEELQKVIEEDDNIKVVLMDMPILGPSSREAAKWSLAAEEQGKYWEYHTKIMNFPGEKSARNLEKLAKDVGLDVDKLKEDKDNKRIGAMLDKNIEQARAMGIRGTPGFIIGKEITPGFIPADELLRIIKDQRN
ncbi:MAG: DsbA family protein [Pseudomonadota bacterium]